MAKVSLPVPPARFWMPLKAVDAFKVPALAPLTDHALTPSVAASVLLPPPPAIEPLNELSPAASVNVSVPAPPTSDSIPVALMLETDTAFAPEILHALPAATPVNVSMPVPPASVWMSENVVVALSVPALFPEITQTLVPWVPAGVWLPPPPPIEPLSDLTPVPSVKLSVPVPPVSVWMSENAVDVLSVPALAPLTDHVLLPSVAASVLLPPPPAIEPLDELTPGASVNVSLPAPPTSDSIPVALMLETDTALAPVMLHALPAATPVSVSMPVPPASVWMPENVVVVLSVPALLPVITHALVPSVAASVLLPPPPAIEPSNEATPVASVKLSVPVPPRRLPKPLKFTKPTPSPSFTMPVFDPVMSHVLRMFGPARVWLAEPAEWAPVPPSISPVMRPAAPNVNVSAPEPPVRLEIPVNVVVVFSEPLPEPSIDQVFVPSVAASVSLPPPPAIEPLNDVTPAASVKLSAPVPPASVWMSENAVAVLSVPALLPVITQAFVPSVAASVLLPPPTAIEPLNDATPAASVKLSVPVPPARLWIPLKAVDVLSVPALLPVITQAFVPSVAASVSLPPPPAIEPLNDVTPAASVKLSAPVPPTR